MSGTSPGDGAALVSSFGACLGALVPGADEVEVPTTDLRRGLAHWRSWLAERGHGLVPIARPAQFHWPGYWIATVEGGLAVLLFGTPSGVVLSPGDERLLGRAATQLPVTDGYVVAALDPSSPAPVAPPVGTGTGVAVAPAEAAGAPLRPVQGARALAGRGLDGDRYARGAGTFTPADPTLRGYDLTLVEAEVLDGLTLPGGATLAYADARRNVVTRGIDLAGLVGRRFRIGDVECIGRRPCEPCAHLERLTSRGVLRSLIHRGGLRADVLTDGEVRVGDLVRTVDT